MLVGFAVWTYTLFIPSFLDTSTAGLMLLQHGPFGIEALRPLIKERFASLWDDSVGGCPELLVAACSAKRLEDDARHASARARRDADLAQGEGRLVDGLEATAGGGVVDGGGHRCGGHHVRISPRWGTVDQRRRGEFGDS